MPSGLNNVLRKSITAVTRNDALLPIVALEGAVIAGRTKKAYDRGGVPEARERVVEETSGSLVWLGGVQMFNWMGDKVITKLLGNGKAGANVDTGHDALRKPFSNFLKNKVFNPKNLSEKTVSLMKFGKIAASVMAANYIIGFIVPSFNHKMTDLFAKKDAKHIIPLPDKSRFDIFKDNVQNKSKEKEVKNKGNVNFTGGLNAFTNFIENTNAGKLLSTDVGVLGGRTYNARKKEEKAEILIRDGASIYFYMWAQDHARAGLNKIESGRWTRLDPESANVVNEHLTGMFKDENASMSVAKFKESVFGKSEVIDLNKFFKEGQDVITLKDFMKIEKDKDVVRRAFEMSDLQPSQLGKRVLSKEQVVGIYTKGEMNSPKFLKKAYETFTEGASSNPNKFVSNKKLKKLQGRMGDYVDDVIKEAEKNGGIVNKKLLKKMNNKNLMFNGVNFVAGFAVAAAFLSVIIPDIQYWFTRKTTGRNDFPGTADYNKQTTVKSATSPNKTELAPKSV